MTSIDKFEKHIVVLSTVYLGVPSANGICARNIVNQLRNLGYVVDVVCYEDSSNIENELLDVHTVKRFTAISDNAFSKIFRKIMYEIKLFHDDATAMMNKDLINAYYKNLEELNQQKKIDAVVAMFFSIESLEAMYLYKLKHHSVYTISYELDSIGDGISQSTRQKLVNNVYSKWLRKVYKVIDKMLVMKSHAEYWKQEFNSFVTKMNVVDIPALVPQGQTLESYKRCTMIYAGLIEKRYRNPAYLLKVLLELKQRLDFDFLFFSKGDCENEITKAATQYAGIRKLGFVKPEVLQTFLAHADFLVSIGNSVSNSLPSKLISYMASGKPIIHFSSQEKDICREYLSQYPLGLIIDQSLPSSQACSVLYDFIMKNRGKNLEFDDIKRKFYLNTPEYSAKLIDKILNNNI